MIDAIAAGHLCVDIIPTITDEATAASDHFLAPGRLTEVGGAVLATGGSVSNTGLALHRLGLDVRLLARVGDDAIGNMTREIIARRSPKLTEELVVGHGEPSSYTVVISPPGFDRTFLHCPGTNNIFGPEDVPQELLRQARLFHFGYPPLMRRMYADDGETLTAIYRRAHAAGATTSLDMAMPDPTKPMGRADWRAILTRVLPYVHIFGPSVEELLFMVRRQRYDALAREVGQANMIDALSAAEIGDLAEETLGLGCRILVIKTGHRGLYLRTAAELGDLGRAAPTDSAAWRNRELWAPVFAVDVASTLGAGDATIAGFLAAVLRDQGPEDAALSAVAVGACNVEAADATSGVRPWDETQQRIDAGWQQRDPDIDAEGWRHDPANGLYVGPHDRK